MNANFTSQILQSLQQIFDAFNRLKIVVIGDVMIDAYIWGKVERISPEAPVPVVNVCKKEQRLGGAGNVLLNIQALGATAVLCSVIGNDANGESLLQLLHDKNLPTEGVLQSPNRITTVKERIIAGSQQIVRIDTETEQTITEAEQALLLEQVQHICQNADVIIFEDYDKGVLSQPFIEAVVAFANNHNIPTVVDPKRRNFLYYSHTTLFKPNLKELREGLKVEFDVNDMKAFEVVVQHLKEQLNIKATLITLSEKGVFINWNDEKHLIPAHIRQIADVSGAGDTVISIAACALALGLNPQQIAALSNLGGGLVCEHIGVVPINKQQLFLEAEKEGIGK